MRWLGYIQTRNSYQNLQENAESTERINVRIKVSTNCRNKEKFMNNAQNKREKEKTSLAKEKTIAVPCEGSIHLEESAVQLLGALQCPALEPPTAKSMLAGVGLRCNC